jgi:hypothetical protein
MMTTDNYVGWRVNRSKPVSLDYVNPYWGYRGNSVTGTAYWVRLDDVRDEAGLQHWLKHLSEKVWFSARDFEMVRDQALKAGMLKTKVKRKAK